MKLGQGLRSHQTLTLLVYSKENIPKFQVEQDWGMDKRAIQSRKTEISLKRGKISESYCWLPIKVTYDVLMAANIIMCDLVTSMQNSSFL